MLWVIKFKIYFKYGKKQRMLWVIKFKIYFKYGKKIVEF